jgi:transposase
MLMKTNRRTELVEHLSEAQLDDAINDAQKADETRLVRRLCFVKNLYEGKTQQQAGAAVGVSQPTSSRWARAWNQNGIEGLRPRFGGGRPPKLSSEQFEELCVILEDGNRGRHRRFAHSSKTATALPTTPRISAESCVKPG